MAAETGMCIQLDTGNATIGEMEEAVDIILSKGNENIIIHHCPSGYPARLNSINLNVIPTLKRMFPYPIAFSDHSPGWEFDIAAVSLGANLIEKTITEDRTTRSVEHIFSLEPKSMKLFVQSIRNLEIALGNNRRKLHQDEIQHRKSYRRSAFLKTSVKKGQTLKEAHIEFRRPGFGISPKKFELFDELCFSKNLPAEHMITFSDLE
ncbi:MAG: N-acetylneuraminic acid synthase [Candidatus Magnetoglobus multicellularis str. Araruama]|uniref:N-acetylneuraminic acid synthase n=1 Tax=Candidatus Magnetoglobus multicellularis str. Araruama TaxID=890399 RepID=A0A1V1NV89_9BACT|nr:MAG: N-acetylneuraminic acid synthase [Candidatus Magnetoglobus multicellularis str. Araruama]